METRTSDKSFPGSTSFKRYIQEVFHDRKEELREVGAVFDDEDFESWNLCCQCISYRVGQKYEDVCPCAYHRSQRQMLERAATTSSTVSASAASTKKPH